MWLLKLGDCLTFSFLWRGFLFFLFSSFCKVTKCVLLLCIWYPNTFCMHTSVDGELKYSFFYYCCLWWQENCVTLLAWVHIVPAGLKRHLWTIWWDWRLRLQPDDKLACLFFSVQIWWIRDSSTLSFLQEEIYFFFFWLCCSHLYRYWLCCSIKPTYLCRVSFETNYCLFCTENLLMSRKRRRGSWPPLERCAASCCT